MGEGVNFIDTAEMYQLFWHANRTSPDMGSLGGRAPMPAGNTPQPAEQSDIVESELRDMLQALIDARCGLSAIHQLLDEARTMAEIRARFARWQASQRDRDK